MKKNGLAVFTDEKVGVDGENIKVTEFDNCFGETYRCIFKDEERLTKNFCYFFLLTKHVLKNLIKWSFNMIAQNTVYSKYSAIYEIV